MNKSEILYGHIYLVNFDPSTGHEFQKCRPALVVESDMQIKKSNLITVIPITSNISNCLQDDLLVGKTKENRLFTDSILKVHSIVSFDPQCFVKRIGTMEEKVLKDVKLYLKLHFDF